MIKKISYINLIKQAQEDKKEIFKSLNKLFFRGEFILGREVDSFEKKRGEKKKRDHMQKHTIPF